MLRAGRRSRCSAGGAGMSVLEYGRQYTAKEERLLLPAGGTVTLLEASGEGVLTHIFIALQSSDPMGRGASLLKIYVEGETAPSIVTDLDGLFGGFGAPVFKTRLI